MTHPARILPAALVAVLALAACGQDGPGTADDGTVPGISNDGMLAPRPVRVTGGGSAAPTAGGTPAAAEEGRASADMLMPYFIANYVVGDGMPALPTDSTGWLFQAGASVTAEQVAALAAQFGVTGEPQRIDDGYQISWRIGPDDGSAPTIWVYQDAQLSWNYSSAWAREKPVVGCAVAEPGVVAPDEATVSDSGGGSDGVATPVDPGTSEPIPPETIVPDCPEPTPPAGVPTKEEAEQRARELITAAGGDPADYRFETYADEWFASVSAVQRLDGKFDGRRWDFGFGGEGVLQYASGQLAEPAPVGPYPLVDLDTAIARLQDQSGFWGVGRGGGIALDDVAVDAAVEPAVGAPAPGDAAMPVDSLPEPEEITVTLVDVQPDVWWAWDVDGSVWLLPAYRFISTDGGWYTVPAVTDEYLVQADVPTPEPVTTEPVTTEPVTTEPVTTEPVTTEPVTTEPVTTEPVTTEPVTTEPVTTEPVTTEPELFDASQLDGSVGTSLADFTAAAEALGATVRVVVQDGEQLAVTEDYSPTRVNVAVEGDIVTEIVSVG